MRNRSIKRYPGRRQSAQASYGMLAVVTLLVLGFLLYWWLRWEFYWVWLVVVNLVAFALFRHDKGQAQRSGVNARARGDFAGVGGGRRSFGWGWRQWLGCFKGCH